jgi:hypothetical protein
MPSPSALLRAALLASALALPAALPAQSALPPTPVSLDTPAAFQPLSANWRLAGDLAGDPRTEKTLVAVPGHGVLVCNPGKAPAERGHLLTAWEHGDLELDLEFLLTPGSNSGVYLQGRYEVQLFDSWGKRAVTPADCGGIYERWDDARGKGKEGFEGVAPRANACRAPGLWQSLHIEFEAPRFDAAGRKVRPARFVKVVLNGFTLHENVEVNGPTRSAAFTDEKALGPLMIQGDHGAVALRRLAVKRFEAGLEVKAENLRYKLYAGDFKQLGDYDRQQPTSEGVPSRFSQAAVEKSGKFALVFTGSLTVPRAGDYRFAIETGSFARLQIDGATVVTPLDRATAPGIIRLTEGKHDFRLDLRHTTNGRPSLELVAEGPGVAPHTVTAREEGGGNRRGRRATEAKAIPVEPSDRVLVQRGFVPFDPRKRLYAASIGSPAGVHFAYDFETGTVLRAWRGSFVDTAAMWEGRGEDQTAKPTGPALTFHGKPTIAMIEKAATGDWPDQPEALWSPQGYELGADGTPVFLSALSDLTIRDRLTPLASGHGLARNLEIKGRLASWSTWVLLAEADRITPQPGGRGWIIGQREWFLDWPANSAHRPVIRSFNGRQHLAIPLSAGNLEKPVNYSIVW